MFGWRQVHVNVNGMIHQDGGNAAVRKVVG